MRHATPRQASIVWYRCRFGCTGRSGHGMFLTMDGPSSVAIGTGRCCQARTARRNSRASESVFRRFASQTQVFPDQLARLGAPLRLEAVGALVRSRAAEVERGRAGSDRLLQHRPVEQHVGRFVVVSPERRRPRHLDPIAPSDRDRSGHRLVPHANDEDTRATPGTCSPLPRRIAGCRRGCPGRACCGRRPGRTRAAARARRLQPRSPTSRPSGRDCGPCDPGSATTCRHRAAAAATS